MQEILVELQGLLSAALTTQFKKYYVGYIKRPPQAYLPILFIYPISTELVSDKLSTSKDRYSYTIGIGIIMNQYKYANVTAADETDKIVKIQQAAWLAMEDRTSGVPIAASILGVIRRNIRGTNFLFSQNVKIDYDEMIVGESAYYKATMTLTFVTDLSTRP